MNTAALLAFLLQTGICAPVEFGGQDGSQLTVLVCPMLKPPSQDEKPRRGPAEDDKPIEPPAKRALRT